MTGLGMFRPRRTPLHVAPAWLKMLGLAVGGVVTFQLDGPKPTAVAAAIALVLLVSTLPPPRATFTGAATLAFFAALGGGYHWIFGDPGRGTEIALQAVAILLAALAVNCSTSADDTLSVFVRLARPLRRWIPTAAIGLMFSLTIRTIPEGARIVMESRSAARARGISRSPRAILLPTALRTVGFALQVGDAITARGLADFDAPETASAAPSLLEPGTKARALP